MYLRDGFVSRDVSPMALTLAVVAGLGCLLCMASFAPARDARRMVPAQVLRDE